MQGQWLWRRSVVAGLVLALTACSSPPETGTKGEDGTNGKNAAVRMVPEPAGARCPNGGTAIQTGLDGNGDGVLGDDEVTQTSYVCGGGGGAGGASSAMSLVKMTPEAAGSRCATGGTAVLSGLDTNADGIQGASEVTSTQYLCNHEDGTIGGAYLVKLLPETSGANCSRGGTAVLGGIDVNSNAQLEGSEVTAKQYVCDTQTAAAGSSGASSLIRQDVEPWGGNCAQGGTAVKSGLDTDGSGTLEPGEVTNTTFVCHGLRGNDGQSGKNSLIRMEAEPAGGNCPNGGTIIGSGLDVNGDRYLNDSEVTSIQYVCSAPMLFRTKWASNPPGSYISGEIPNMWVPVSRRVTIYKTKDTSRLKLTVSDNFRVGYNISSGTGTYSVRMNGSSMGCDAQQYSWNAIGWGNDYRLPFANVCLTDQLPKGLYEFDVWVYGDAGTSLAGHGVANALLIAEELDDTQPYAFSKEGGGFGTSSTSALKATGREVNFTKQSASTLLKVTLADTLLVGYNQSGGWGTVTVRLDGVNTSCYTGKYDAQGTTAALYNPFVMTCVLPGVSAAPHRLDVTLTANSAGQAHLGWSRSNPLLLVEEVPSAGRSYSNPSVESGEVSGNMVGVNARQVTHYVSSTGRTVKVTYSDTFRAAANCNGRWGFFQLYVDYQPVSCSNGQYPWNSGGGAQNHHHPMNLTCLIPNLTPGYHSFSIWSTTQQGGAMTCSNYFGWTRGQNLLLVEDLP